MFSVENAAIVGAWGLIVSVSGLLLTAVGFAFTLVQLNRTKTATQAAADAIDKLKNRMRIFDTSVESARAIKFFEACSIHLKNKYWDIASLSLWEGYSILNRINDDLSHSDNDKKTTDQNMLDILSHINDLEAIDKKSVIKYDHIRVVKTLRSQIAILEKVITQSQKDAKNG